MKYSFFRTAEKFYERFNRNLDKIFEQTRNIRPSSAIIIREYENNEFSNYTILRKDDYEAHVNFKLHKKELNDVLDPNLRGDYKKISAEFDKEFNKHRPRKLRKQIEDRYDKHEIESKFSDAKKLYRRILFEKIKPLLVKDIDSKEIELKGNEIELVNDIMISVSTTKFDPGRFPHLGRKLYTKTKNATDFLEFWAPYYALKDIQTGYLTASNKDQKERNDNCGASHDESHEDIRIALMKEGLLLEGYAPEMIFQEMSQKPGKPLQPKNLSVPELVTYFLEKNLVYEEPAAAIGSSIPIYENGFFGGLITLQLSMEETAENWKDLPKELILNAINLLLANSFELATEISHAREMQARFKFEQFLNLNNYNDLKKLKNILKIAQPLKSLLADDETSPHKFTLTYQDYCKLNDESDCNFNCIKKNQCHKVTVNCTDLDIGYDRNKPQSPITQIERLLTYNKELRYRIKSAVAAIMSRNMSHNIGSHILARLSKEGDIKNKATNAKIADLNTYLRTRMDFLADVSTGHPLVTMPLHFYWDVVKDFLQQQMVLDHISGRDDLKSKNIKIMTKYKNEEITSSNISRSDPLFACPNGLMGSHAFYVIIENIIRNSAKHGYKRNQQNRLEINIGIEEYGNTLFRIRIWDNLYNCVSTRAEANKNTVNSDRKYAVLENLNSAIEESIIDNEGALKPGNWGIREMKICAAYLCKTPLEEIGSYDDLLKAVKVNDEGNTIEDKNEIGNLGYEFYLLRPKELLLVGKDVSLEKNKTFLRQHGIYVEQALTEENTRKGIDHNFLMLLNPDETEAELMKKYEEKLPIRLFVYRNDNISDIAVKLEENHKNTILKDLSSKSPQKALHSLWAKWVEYLKDKLNGQKSVMLAINENQYAPWGIKGLSVNISTRTKGKLPFMPYYIYNEGDSEGLWEKVEWPEKFVIYDRHGEVFKKLQEGNYCAFWEPYNQDEPVARITQYPPNDPAKKKILPHELVEAGLIRVTLLDERIQEALQDLEWNYPGCPDGKMPAGEILNRWMNVKLPDKATLDLDKEGDKEKVKEWIQKHSKEDFFLVIHQGILDRIGLEESEKSKEWIDDIKEKARIKHVVVDSGRGIPFNVPQNARFVPLSALMRWTVENKSKYHLCKLLFSSRRIHYA